MRALFALFVRSIRQDTRAKLPPILRTALVLIILLIVFVKQREFGYTSDQGLELLMSVMLLNLGFLGVAAVSIFPSAIAEEKEDETLSLLRMTNLSPVSILVGKCAPQFIGGFLLLAAQIPFTLIAQALGGISIDQVWQSYAIVGATLFFLCCLALLASVVCRTIVRAGFLTGGIGALLYVGGPLLIAPILHDVNVRSFIPSTLGEHVAKAVLNFHPVWNFVELLEPFRGGGFHVECVWLNLGAGVFCFLLAWAFFERFCMQAGEVVPRAAVVKTKGPSQRRVSRAWNWALVWKDLHFTVGGWRGLRNRLLWAVLLFGLAYGYTRWIDPPRHYQYSPSSGVRVGGVDETRLWRSISFRAILYGIFCAGLDVLLIAGRIFGNERRGLTLASLVSLPWSTRRIFWQKVLGCLPAMIPWVLLIFAGMAASGDRIFKDIMDGVRDFSLERNSDDVSHALYVLAQGLCLLFLTVLLSLRIRRGALPAAIVLMVVWNVLFFLCLDSVSHSNEVPMIFAGIFFTSLGAVLIYLSIHRRMEVAATED